ncbi:MAG: ATP-binding protein [Mucilaginibacter sp.]
MTIKNNLRAGIGFLFVVASLSSGLAAYYLYRLSEDEKAILKDNYRSLVFSKNMDEALDLPNIPLVIQQQIIEKNIMAEEGNITEPGEKAMADSLYSNFLQFRESEDKPLQRAVCRANMKIAIYGIMSVNMKAIYHRNKVANENARAAILVVLAIDTFCIITALIFLVKFPGYITNPINQLTQGIKEIANKNYHKRLQFTAKDEFWDLAQSFNQMAARLHDYESSNIAKIRIEQLRVEAIVQNVTDAIIGFDENSTILFANPVAVKILGANEAELVGRPATDVAIENDLLASLIDDSGSFNDIKLYLDGAESYFSRELFEINAPDDGLFNKNRRNRIGYFILLKNITRFYQLDEAKTNFIATISHELKTPIGSLKMSLKMLEDERFGTTNDFQKELIKNIDDDSDRLLKITSELLDMGQVETGKLLLNFGSTHPLNIINYTYETIKVIAKQKEVEVKISCSKRLPEVWADVDKTTWVLINFLSNAIKYSSPRTVIELTIKKHSSKMIEFSVKDYGRGIEETYLPRVFERYFKVPGAGSNISGTGLGLAIAKDFIEAQGGQIGVESKIGEGSRFYFLLPVSLI